MAWLTLQKIREIILVNLRKAGALGMISRVAPGCGPLGWGREVFVWPQHLLHNHF